MRHFMGIIGVILLLVMNFAITPPSYAITPEEQLDNPVLEERARHISAQLRCLVCQNQSIDDSDADLARDLRLEVRALLTEGLSDAEILDRVRATYGDYVLLNPPVSGATSLLWAAPIILVLLAVIGLFVMGRRSIAAKDQHLPTDITEEASAVSAATQNTNSPADDASSLSPRLLGIGIIIIGLMTAGLYAYLGRPDLEAQPLAQRQVEIANAASQDKAASTALRQSLDAAKADAAENPNSVERQLRLAMIAAEAAAHDVELTAIDRALTLTDGNPAIKSIKAEALSRKAGGLVTIPARDLIAEVLAIAPDEPRALYLFGLAAYQDEDYITAMERWGQLQAIVAPNSPLAQRVTQNIADAAERAGVAVPENTSPFAMAEGMTSEEQADMIAGMVEGLEERLIEDPDDRDGWDRLINARRVLNDTEGLIRALIGAANANADDLERQVIALEVIVLEQQEPVFLDTALTLLDRINTLAPRGPEFLFFAGHFAVISGERALAISLWQELEASLDQSNPIKAQLRDQIRSLQNDQ